MQNFYGFTLILLIATCHGGLVQQRYYRDVAQQPDQIPVQVIELAEGEELQQPITLGLEPKKDTLVKISESVTNEILAPQTDILKQPAAVAETTLIAEDIAEAFEEKQRLSAVNALKEVEQKKDEQLVVPLETIVEKAVKEENQPLLRAAAAALEQPEEPKKEIKEPAPEIEIIKIAEIPVPTVVVDEKPLQQLEEKAPIQQLKLEAEEPSVIAVAVEEYAKQPVAVEVVPAEQNLDVAAPNLRQAAVTQPTPIQTSTQQNFLQQLIQPVGQFFGQFTGGQQQQAATATDSNAPAPAAPLPTLPGFLNPAVAITSAQQAVQNAAQTVVNSTSQAFQGLQQFASNLGNSVQNTLSGLGGQQQQQLSTADATTTRPPGPFQAIISNFIGGGAQQQQQPPSEPLPGTGGGPLQGIISFFQGGNRPALVAAAVLPTTAEPVKVDLPTSAPGVDDKIDDAAAAQEETVVLQDEAAAAAVASNEVRASAEVVEGVAEDSFEESQPEELIVVNDDAATETDSETQLTN